MITTVTDSRSNRNDQIEHAARMVGKSPARQKVFQAIFRGKKKTKTIQEISEITGLTPKQVLNAGIKLSGNLIVTKVKNGYEKDTFFSQHYREILSLSKSKKKLNALPTKTSKSEVVNRLPAKAGRARLITIDEIDNFSKVRGIVKIRKHSQLREIKLKELFSKVIGEKGVFKDWGGEKNDLFTTFVKMRGKRFATAIAFKGIATKGTLVPAKMGKNGDQILRLFETPANIFLVVFQGRIDQSIVAQMRLSAMAVALTNQDVYFGIVNSQDISRVLQAYSK